MLDSQDYIMYIINEHEILPTNHPTHVYIDRVINRLVFKIKDWHKVELQMSEILKLFGSPKKVIDKTKKGENVASIEVVEVVLKQCSLVDNQYQQKSEVLNTFMYNKSYAYLWNVESSNLVFLKSYNAEFDGNIVTFTDQNVRPWEIEGKWIWNCLLINTNDVLFHRTRSKKICQKVWIFIFCKMETMETSKHGKILNTARKTGLNEAKTASQKVVYKTAETTGELIGNKIGEKFVKPKHVPDMNSRNFEEMVVPLDKGQEILNKLKQVL